MTARGTSSEKGLKELQNAMTVLIGTQGEVREDDDVLVKDVVRSLAFLGFTSEIRG